MTGRVVTLAQVELIALRVAESLRLLLKVVHEGHRRWSHLLRRDVVGFVGVGLRGQVARREHVVRRTRLLQGL